jgi:hypothetical protein
VENFFAEIFWLKDERRKEKRRKEKSGKPCTRYVVAPTKAARVIRQTGAAGILTAKPSAVRSQRLCLLAVYTQIFSVSLGSDSFSELPSITE